MLFNGSKSLLLLCWVGDLIQGLSTTANASCVSDTFASLTLDNIEVLSLQVEALYNQSAGGGSGEQSAGGIPTTSRVKKRASSTFDLCQITVTYTHPGQDDTVNAYIGLPLENWNNRFIMEGGSGWTAGSLSNALTGVASGYSSSSTDGGHNSSASVASWGLVSEGNVNWPALQDFAAVALDEAASLGKLATELFYGTAPVYSYWNGCSTGGRQGHMMAQRFYSQFDGIVAGCSAFNWDKFVVANVWPQVVANNLGIAPPSCVLNYFTDAAIDACDALDGVVDGIIALPYLCDFNATSLIGDSVTCTDPLGNITITDADAELVNAIWAGPTAENGKLLWYGTHKDAYMTTLLDTSCTLRGNCTVEETTIATNWVEVFVMKNSTYSTLGMSLDEYRKAFRQSVNQYASVIGTEDPDLTDFKLAGGKLLTWHGMADPLIYPNGTYDYYQRALDFDPDVTDYYRFFPAPGVYHCGSGPGFDPSDYLFNALVAWVENGTAPETMTAVAEAVGNSTGTRTAQLCQYPKIFTYIGGDPNDASSFTCV